MKLHHLLIPVAIIAVAALAVGVYQANSAPLPDGFPSPTPPNQIEVKEYPPYRAATYPTQGNFSQAASNAFYPLFQHISANNISMTAPVETRYPISTLEGDLSGEATVSFLYRNLEINPSEIDSQIEVKDIPAMMVVSLGLKGAYSYESYQDGLKQLTEWLNKRPEYERVGSPRRFFYDGPYVPDALKRSEIQIPIEKR
ncbi:MAG: heme-binding protein [Microcystaceae cyanobacterium]